MIGIKLLVHLPLMGLLAIGFPGQCAGAEPTSGSMHLSVMCRGKEINPDPAAGHAIIESVEALFSGADTSKRLLLTPRRINAVRKQECGIEIIYPKIQERIVMGKRIRYTKLLLPLTGELSTGTVIFAGSAHPDDRRLGYSELQEYRGINHVHNSSGVGGIKKLLSSYGISIK